MSEEAKMKDPEQAELELKMSKDILAMPEGVQPRFKALMTLYDQVNRIDEAEDVEYRQLELKYEKMYQTVYAKRLALISGDKGAIEEELVAAFDARREELMGYPKAAEVEVGPCDVKEIQNTPYGVSGFWLKAMLANKETSAAIFEKDRSILGYLSDVSLELHEEGFGYTLSFHFEKNSYFKETVLRKAFKMSQQNIIESCEGTEISWLPGCDVTKAKKKKGKGKNKKTVTVKCDSFFNFFESIDVSDKKTPGEDSDEEGSGDERAEQVDADYELGNTIKDDLVPLALEYYLGVVEQADSDDEDGDNDGDSDDSDEKPSKKPTKGAGPTAGQPQNKEECKQQ